MDLVGHALIMAIIVIIAIDPTREMHFLPALKKGLRSVPVGLAAALVVIAGSYWGLHTAIYGPGGRAPTEQMTTHTPDPDHPHADEAANVDAAPHDHTEPLLVSESNPSQKADSGLRQ